MKRIIMLCMGLLLILSGCQYLPGYQSFEDVFDKYYDKPGVTAVSLPAKVGEPFAADANVEEEDMEALMKDLKHFKVLLLNRVQDADQVAEKIINEMTVIMARDIYEDMLMVQSDDVYVLVKVHDDNGVIREAIALIDAEETVIAASLDGKLDKENFAKILSSVSFDELGF